MHTPRPLPPELATAFTLAQARQLGVGRSRLDGPDLERPFYGVRTAKVPVLADDTRRSPAGSRLEISRLSRAYSVRMVPAEFFSHLTAAVLWDIPLPYLRDQRLDVSVFRPRRAPRSEGIRGHQADPKLIHLVTLDGLRVSSPASTWASLGAVLAPYDLVAAGDAIVCVRASGGGNGAAPRPPLATLDQLHSAIAAGRRPGIGALRDAFGRIRTGSWSRLETWVRLILVDAGLPEPVLNFDAYDDAGRFLGCIDLAYPELKIAIEYEGAHHWMTAEQFQRDIDRLNRLVEAGWRIVRLAKKHVLTDPAEVVRRVSVARQQHSATR